ncbi:HD domain-containing protein, partial [bacterium]|nr:HD domain-containing protein [candidate division CSSED10-310 bacterium]
ILEKRAFIFTSEHERLLRGAVRRFRHHLEPRDLIDDLVDVAQKLTGADRAAVYLREPGQETFQLHMMHRQTLSPDLDARALRASSLFEKALSEKSSLFSPDIQGDRRFKNIAICRHIGPRAVLITPMRGTRDIVGVLYLDIRTGNHEMMAGNASFIQELVDEAALSLEVSTLYQDLDDSFMSMVRALGTTVDAKDPHTHGHAARVAEYALQIGREMGLRAEDLRDLEIGAYLHDIGKIGIAGVILKSRDRLTEEEMEAIRHHPEIGTRILSPIRKLSKVALAIRQHHERFDGKGYPDQLKGDEIMLIARIIAVADALDAMTTVRPYQTPMTLSQAVAVITGNAGTQFDPHIAAIVNQLFQRGQLNLA